MSDTDDAIDLAALQRDVRYLKDRLAVVDTIAQHSRGCDRHDIDLITAAYHDDGVDEHGAATKTGPGYAAWANASHAATSQVRTHNITTHSTGSNDAKADGESPCAVRPSR